MQPSSCAEKAGPAIVAPKPVKPALSRQRTSDGGLEPNFYTDITDPLNIFLKQALEGDSKERSSPLRNTSVSCSQAPGYTFNGATDTPSPFPAERNQEIKFLLSKGVRALLCLDKDEASKGDFERLCKSKKIHDFSYIMRWEYTDLHISDYRAPSLDQLSRCVRCVRRLISDSKKHIHIHCGFGAGRTGTVLCAVIANLDEFRRLPQEYIDYSRSIYHPGKDIVETEEQVAVLNEYIMNGKKQNSQIGDRASSLPVHPVADDDGWTVVPPKKGR